MKGLSDCRVATDKYRDNYDKIFKKKEPGVKGKQEDNELVQQKKQR